MAGNKYWTPKTNNVDDVLAEDFNNAFDNIKNDIGNIEIALDNKIDNNSLGFILTNGTNKKSIDYDGISGDAVFNIDMASGSLTNCSMGQIEILEYWDSNTNRYVNVQTKIDNINADIAVINNNIGNIETALDNIIAIQNSLIGGGTA